MRSVKLYDVQLYPCIDDRQNYLALRDGHTIDIPANIWFIGTANRDESTFEISDKVYDRAITINFDKRSSMINIMEPVNYPNKFVSYSELRRLFNNAIKFTAFDPENYDAIKKVEMLLRPYKITFGNRILKQIGDFVKVYIACSDITTGDEHSKYIHEAVDCIILSKIVRKLEFKQIFDMDSLIDEFSTLNLTRCVEFLNTIIETI